MGEFKVGSWVYSKEHQKTCQIVEVITLWGNTTYRIWLQDQNVVARIHKDKLKPLGKIHIMTPAYIAYITAAARIIDTLTHDTLLAPIGSPVIPLPHQIRALSRAVAHDRVRYLLADEVDLGKTIEAGLIMQELKLRGKIARVLIVVPRGLVNQWAAEMRTHFNEDFKLLIPGDFPAYRKVIKDNNIWKHFSQVICPIGSVKPIKDRKGWSKEQIAEYNKERFEDLISAGWDLIIIDEAHRLGGSTDQIARYKLGLALSGAAPYLLLLSAIPHQGKTDAFHRLISLLDQDAFPDMESIIRERVNEYVIRTEKRQAICPDGKPLFKPRKTQLKPIAWGNKHKMQRALYHAVTDYVREGYNRAILEKRNYIGFLLLLMQRLVASSTRAIRISLERRLGTLEDSGEHLPFFHGLPIEEWLEFDGQEQFDIITKCKLEAVKNEYAEVRQLLKFAKECDEESPDVKAKGLIEWIYRLQREEKDPELKILVFTEFVATQGMLYNFLTSCGFHVVCLNGSMNMEERELAQRMFADHARILISTDAGGEGLNLQFCHVVINYDIPWNPMRLEQRIGRVDRIGQNKAVRAINLVLKDSVEYRILKVLEEKLSIIFNEFGVDKTGDVLDSAEAANIFEELYVNAILNPDKLEISIDHTVNRIKTQVKQTKESMLILGSTKNLLPNKAEEFIYHPLPYWVERMTINYIRAHGGKTEKHIGGWNLRWPGSLDTIDAVFTNKEAEINPVAKHLTLQDTNIRNLITHLPRFVPGQFIPVIKLANISRSISGFWFLCEIYVYVKDWNRRKVISLFLHDDERILIPTSKKIWDELLSEPIKVSDYIQEQPSLILRRLMDAIETYGEAVYEELAEAYKEHITWECKRKEHLFKARTRAIEKIGLQTVKNYRLRQLRKEMREWEEIMEQNLQPIPDIIPLMVIRIERGASYG
jgi:superfamily II DNA or RNA helicase